MTNWADVSGHGHGSYVAEIHLDEASWCVKGGVVCICKHVWWLQLKYFWNFHPEPWGNDPI